MIRIVRFAAITALSALLVLAVSAALSAPPAGASPSKPKSILVLHSYNAGLTWTDGIQQGIDAALARAPFPVNRRIEYLDAKNFNDQAYFDLMAEVFTRKYAASQPDLVVVSDNAAFDFILDRRGTFLPGVPMVFCGVNDFEPSMLRGDTNATGVSEVPSFRDTIALIRKLRPQTHRVFVTGDKTVTTRINQAAIRKAAEGFPELSFEFSEEEDAAALKRIVSGFTKETAILMISVLRDQSGYFLSFGQSAEALSRAAPVPIFSCWDFMIGHGVVGGKMVSSTDQGRAAGDMAVELLSGRPIESVPVLYDSPNRFMFDYAALTRFGIDEDLLPKNSQIYGKPQGISAINPAMAWSIGGLFAAMLAVIAALGVNVQRRKLAEAAAEAGETRLRKIADALPALIAHIGADERYLFANRRYETVFGMAPEAMAGRTVREVVGDEGYSKVEGLIHRALSGEEIAVELDMALPDGRTMAMHVHYIPGRGEDGRVDSYYLLADDISPIRRMRDELRQTRNYLTKFIDTLPEFLAGVDSKTRVVYFNTEAERISGVSRAEAAGCELASVFELPADLREIIRDTVRDNTVHKRERIILRAGGKAMLADLFVYPLAGADNRGAVLRLADVTGRAVKEEVLVQNEKLLALGGLAAGMANEINNPLSGILQAAQVISRRLDPAIPGNAKAAASVGLDLEALQAYLGQRGVLRNLAGIRDLSERAAAIVAGMLPLSKRGESRVAPVRVADMIDTVLKLAAQDYELKKKYDFQRISVTSEVEPGLPAIPCERIEIEQALLALIKNAAQTLAGRAAEENAAIAIRAYRDDGFAAIEIADNGPGMSEDVRARVFEPFAGATGPQSGAGLGLCVVRHIVVENHKGRLAAESRPGQGSKFTIRFPLPQPGERP